MPTKIPEKLAIQVKAWAGERCEYCHAPQRVIGQAFHVEHIIPRSKGGANTFDNLAFAYPHCNLAKADKTQAVDPVTQKMVALFHLKKDLWEEHFRWSHDFIKLLGKTAVGRTTIKTLKMNDHLLQQARYYWHLADLLP